VSNKPVRTRFAPSPTGSLHIGGLRTALFNWLFAKHHGGQFILRIEDTDQTRFDPTALQTLIEALQWAGLQWDEGPVVGGAYGPYVQSERLELYQKWANWLVEHGHAYKCYCSPERLEQVNKEKEARKEPSGYDRHCRNLSAEEKAAKEAEGIRPVIRLKAPPEGKTLVQDVIRGETEFDNSTLQDMVLLKSDGYPTYHLAVVIDDHHMEISHVMRAVEWYPSYPYHRIIWKAFGWEMPLHAHLPVMLNPNGKGKMSKRNPPVDKFGNIIPVMVHDYIKGGYLPEAMDNFLANIGWNFGDNVEIFSMAEAVERFGDLSRVNPANSAFPVEKLDWVNGEHIQKLALEDLAKRLRPFFEEAGYEVNVDTLLQVTPLVQPRIKTLKEAVGLAGFFFADYADFKVPPAELLIQKKMDAEGTVKALEASISLAESVEDFSTAKLLEAYSQLVLDLGLKNAQLFGVLRVAVTGQQISPPTFETMEILGKAESIRRIKLAIEAVKATV
jgi:glutamyl-tRNA synthetase